MWQYVICMAKFSAHPVLRTFNERNKFMRPYPRWEIDILLAFRAVVPHPHSVTYKQHCSASTRPSAFHCLTPPCVRVFYLLDRIICWNFHLTNSYERSLQSNTSHLVWDGTNVIVDSIEIVIYWKFCHSFHAIMYRCACEHHTICAPGLTHDLLFVAASP